MTPTGAGTALHHAYLQATTMTWAGIVACQMGAAFAVRTTTPRCGRSACSHNRHLLRGVAFALAFAAAIIYAPPLQSVFQTAALPAPSCGARLLPVHRLGFGRTVALAAPQTPRVIGCRRPQLARIAEAHEHCAQLTHGATFDGSREETGGRLPTRRLGEQSPTPSSKMSSTPSTNELVPSARRSRCATARTFAYGRGTTPTGICCSAASNASAPSRATGASWPQ